MNAWRNGPPKTGGRIGPTLPFKRYALISGMTESDEEPDVKAELRASYKRDFIDHFIIHSKESWLSARPYLVREVAFHRLIGVCIKSGRRNLIGESLGIEGRRLAELK